MLTAAAEVKSDDGGESGMVSVLEVEKLESVWSWPCGWALDQAPSRFNSTRTAIGLCAQSVMMLAEATRISGALRNSRASEMVILAPASSLSFASTLAPPSDDREIVIGSLRHRIGSKGSQRTVSRACEQSLVHLSCFGRGDERGHRPVMNSRTVRSTWILPGCEIICYADPSPSFMA